LSSFRSAFCRLFVVLSSYRGEKMTRRQNAKRKDDKLSHKLGPSPARPFGTRWCALPSGSWASGFARSDMISLLFDIIIKQ
jgi:hypothetical protein